MSAILGFLPAEPGLFPKEDRWQHALEQLTRRCMGEPVQHWDETCCVAQTVSHPEDMLVTGDKILMFDGYLEAPDVLAHAIGLEADGISEAKLIVETHRQQGWESLEKLEGSYAFACVDLSNGIATLVRDRFGTKPLVYTRTAEGWYWASESKVLRPFLDTAAFDPRALSEAIHFRWLVGDRKILQGIHQALPACRTTLASRKGEAETHKYWTVTFHSSSERMDAEEWADRLDNCLDDHFAQLANRYKTAGILLSGGVDSSLMAAKAQQHFAHCVAVTPHYEHGDNPEFTLAKRVADRLGIEHIAADVDDRFVHDFFPVLCQRMEQPPKHYSSIALGGAFKAMPSDVDAVFHGNAADTMFGISGARFAQRFAQKSRICQAIPGPVRRLVGKRLPRRPHTRLSRIRKYLMLTPEQALQQVEICDSLTDLDKLFPGIPEEPEPNPQVLAYFSANRDNLAALSREHILYTVIVDHFEAIDRLSAPYAFHVIAPFVSSSIRELALRVPHDLLSEGDILKPVVRALAARYFPHEWIYGPKYGFNVPFTDWLEGPLKPYVDVLTQGSASTRDLYNVNVLKTLTPEKDGVLLWTAAALEIVAEELGRSTETDHCVRQNSP